MLHRNEAQTRHSFKRSAPQTFQQPQLAQNAANGGMTSQPKQHMAGAPTAAAGATGISSTMCTSLSLARSPLPSPLSTTTPYTKPTLRPAAPTTNGKAQSECRAQQAPLYYNKHGNKQASSSSLQLGGGSTPAAATPAAVTPAAARSTLQPAITTPRLEPGTPRLHSTARNLPFGAGHEQAEPGMSPLPITSKKINSDDRKKLQAGTKIPEARQLFNGHRTNAPTQLHFLARNALHPPGKGSEQAGRNGLQLGDSTTPAAASARFTLQLASTAWAHRVPHMRRPAQDPAFEARHEQAQPVMDPLAVSIKKINSDVRNKLQDSTQVPEARQLFKVLGEQASDKIHCLAGDAPLPPTSADDCEPGESKLPGESTPHDTPDPDTLQSAEYTTKANPMLPGRQGPTNMPARKCSDKQQPRPAEPIVQKKNPAVLFGARRLANVTAPMQQTHDPTTSAMSSFSARTRAARDPSLGAGHEQPEAGTGEKMGQSPPGGTFPAVLSSAPQTSGGARFKIPTLKPRSNNEGGMQDGASKSSKGKGRVGLRASEGSSRGMGGGQTTLEPRRSPQGRKEKGRG